MKNQKLKKRLASILAALTIVLMGTQCIYATESHNWISSKIPGSSTTTKKTVEFHYFTGSISFEATYLTADSSYVAGKCVGKDIVIDNATQSALASQVNIPAKFKVKRVYDGREFMYFEIYADHNATSGQNVYAKGIIYY